MNTLHLHSTRNAKKDPRRPISKAKRAQLAQQAQRATNATPAESIVHVEQLTMGWDNVTLQENLTFNVKRGEIFAILGGSGCGKSTLMRYLVGLEEITKGGTITVCGKQNIDLDEDLPPYGVMFQQGALFGSMTVGENVALPLEEWTHLPRDAVSAIAKAKLRLVGLDKAYDKFPNELSGGMIKRAAIARALVLEPQLVFFDEPSAGLDPVTSAELDQLILTLNQSLGLTVVVVTHELESIFAIVQRCIMLDKDTKSIIADGNPHDLKNMDDERVSDFFNRRPHENAPETIPPSSQLAVSLGPNSLGNSP